jgi:hypothetical protein
MIYNYQVYSVPLSMPEWPSRALPDARLICATGAFVGLL